MKRKRESTNDLEYFIDNIKDLIHHGEKFTSARKQLSAYINGENVTTESLKRIVHALSSFDIDIQKRFLHFVCLSAVRSAASTSFAMWTNMRLFIDVLDETLRLGNFMVLKIINSLERTNVYNFAISAFKDLFVKEPQFAPVCIINDDSKLVEIVLPRLLASIEPKMRHFQIKKLASLSIRHAALNCFSWLTKTYPSIKYVNEINDMTPQFVTFYFREVLNRGATINEIQRITNMETLLAVAKVIYEVDNHPQTLAPVIYETIAKIDYENKMNFTLMTLKKRHFISMSDLSDILQFYPMTEVIASVLMKSEGGRAFIKFPVVADSFSK